MLYCSWSMTCVKCLLFVAMGAKAVNLRVFSIGFWIGTRRRLQTDAAGAQSLALGKKRWENGGMWPRRRALAWIGTDQLRHIFLAGGIGGRDPKMVKMAPCLSVHTSIAEPLFPSEEIYLCPPRLYSTSKKRAPC